MPTLAILDLGSNSVRMMVNRINADGSYEVLDRRQEMVRMSAGMGEAAAGALLLWRARRDAVR